MASYTPNYNLKKPADADTYDIADANGNMDLIDTALHSQNEAITNLETNTNIQALTSTEGIKTIALDTTRCPANTTRWFNVRNSLVSELPDSSCVYAVARVAKRLNNIAYIELYNDSGKTFTNTYDGSSWAGWQELALKSEVASLQQNGIELFGTTTEVTGGADITLSQSGNNFAYLVLRMSNSNSDGSSTRGVVMIPTTASGIAAWYPICVAGTSGGIRISLSGTTLTINATTGLTNLYIVKVLGCVKIQ